MLSNLTGLRDDATAAFKAALAAADPGPAVADALGDQPFRREPLRLLSIGKAARKMIVSALDVIDPALLVVPPLVVTTEDSAQPLAGVVVLAGSHPVPDETSGRAGDAVIELVTTTSRGVIVVLLSGGASSLVVAPAPGLTVDDKAWVTTRLLRAGVDITALNTVRRQLSRLKGGGLVRMADGASLVTLAMSDVPGDDPMTIGSGPTLPDPTTSEDAIEVMKEAGCWDSAPLAIRRHLRGGGRKESGGPGSDRVIFANSHFELIGSNATSVRAAAALLTLRGHRTNVHHHPLVGEAASAGRSIVRDHLVMSDSPVAEVWGGETTVVVDNGGVGGRAQELALAAAVEGDGRDGWVLLSAGTDGHDGVSIGAGAPAAGAIVDGGTAQRIRDAGLDPKLLLATHDSNKALTASGDLLITGSTGTNVGDIQVFIRAI